MAEERGERGRWTGSWLSGPASVAEPGTAAAQPRGVRLGLPAEGSASVAPTGPRLAAFVVDALASALVAGLFTAPEAPRNWSLAVFAVMTVVLTATAGQTLGMRLARVRVGVLPSLRPLGLWRALVRTALLVLLVPALITDRDGRGLHDRAVGAVVVRA